ncbi:MAG: hypothetical protein ACREVZ_03930, partial [Burkholderiales bacterium]
MNVLLVLTLWLSPVVQAYARTLSQAHCRVQGHISMTAPDAAHDATHAAHHGQPSPDAPASHEGHGAAPSASAGDISSFSITPAVGHAEQCK